ncbi:MAG: ATP-binding cassette domain-containing protein [Clostridia bacterium]|nr:ATP-binding cassette domain-containing protein [Clostridia bacterium]
MPKLLSAIRLKKYFPVGKQSFWKEKKFLRANDGVSIEIENGETFGLVGESGCGKSTLGRVILQLLPPTGGSATYYGRSRSELAPRYEGEILKNAERYRAAYRERDPSQPFTDELLSAARVLGGFLATTDGESLRLFKKRYEANRLKKKTNDEETKKRLNAYLDGLNAEILILKKSFSDSQEFRECEEHFDEGVDLARLTPSEMRFLRTDLQIVFQDPYSSLNPRMTVGQLIEEGVATHGYYKKGSPQMRKYVLEVMKNCGLQEYAYYRYPHQFSGGQRQRVCIARALAVKPRFIVCDECVSALDVSIQSQILNLLSDLKKKEGLTYLFISHDLSVVRHVSDKIAVMYLGKIVETGEAEEVFQNARHPYTIALLSAAPDLEDGERERILLDGNLPSPVSPPSGCPFHTRCFMAQECCKRGEVPMIEIEKGHKVACHFAEKTKAEKEEIYRKNRGAEESASEKKEKTGQ